MSAINGFNTTLSGKPIPPRPAPYIANFKDACTVGDTLAKAIKHMPTQTFKGAKPVSFYSKGTP